MPQQLPLETKLDRRLAWTTRSTLELRARAVIPALQTSRIEDWTLLTDAVYLQTDRHLLLTFAAIESLKFLDAPAQRSHLSHRSLCDFLAELELPIRVFVFCGQAGEDRLGGWLLDVRPGLLIIGPTGQGDPIGVPAQRVVAIELIGLAASTAPPSVDNSEALSARSDLVVEQSPPDR